MLSPRETDTTGRAAPVPVKYTRDGLLDGSLLALARAFAARERLDVRLRSDSEIDALVDQSLAAQPNPSELWVFAYGSLIWNPTFLYDDRRKAVLRDWHRQFCTWSPIGRGTRECPTLVLALEAGGRTEGIAFRLQRGEERTELAMIFRREMLSDDYIPRWVKLETGTGPIHAIVFIANPRSKGYAGFIPDEEVAAVIATASGRVGTSLDYLRETMAHFTEFGLRDENLERIHRLVEAQAAARS